MKKNSKAIKTVRFREKDASGIIAKETYQICRERFGHSHEEAKVISEIARRAWSPEWKKARNKAKR